MNYILNKLYNIAENLGYTVRVQKSVINPDNLFLYGTNNDEDIIGGIIYPPEAIIILCDNDEFVNTFSHELGHAVCDKLYGWFYHDLPVQIKESLADKYGDLILQILNSTQYK